MNPFFETMNRRQIATLAVSAAAVVGGGWMLTSREFTSESAPEISYTLLDRSVVTMTQLKGQVVLVNFWATSCSSCVAEMPQLVRTHQRFQGRGYATVAVAMKYDAPANVARFAQERQLPFGVAIDNTGQIARRFGDVKLTPTSFLIDRQGKVVMRFVGAPDFALLDGLIERLLQQA